MTPSQIKQKRTESLLVELIPEALSSMNDPRMHEINVVEVVCSRGRSDAKVFLDAQAYSEKDKNLYLKLLRAALPIIESHIMQDQGWYRCPNLVFEYDTHFAQVAKMEDLFKKISQKQADTTEADADIKNDKEDTEDES